MDMLTTIPPSASSARPGSTWQRRRRRAPCAWRRSRELGIQSALWGGTVPGQVGSPDGHAIITASADDRLCWVGHLRSPLGRGGEYAARAKAGISSMVPAFLPHMEINRSDTEPFHCGVRSTPTPIVVNLRTIRGHRGDCRDPSDLLRFCCGVRHSRRVHPERLHAVAAAFLAHEAFTKRAMGAPGSSPWDGRSASRMVRHGRNAGTGRRCADRSSLLPPGKRRHLTPDATLTCDLPEIGRHGALWRVGTVVGRDGPRNQRPALVCRGGSGMERRRAGRAPKVRSRSMRRASFIPGAQICSAPSQRRVSAGFSKLGQRVVDPVHCSFARWPSASAADRSFMEHRIVEHGRSSGRIIAQTNRFAALALLPLAFQPRADLAIVLAYRFGTIAGVTIGSLATTLALVFLVRRRVAIRKPAKEQTHGRTGHARSTSGRDMLTRSPRAAAGRPGAVRLQMAVLLTDAFGDLPPSSKVPAHRGALLIATSIILLMSPRFSPHRLYGARHRDLPSHRLGIRHRQRVPLRRHHERPLCLHRRALDSAALGAAVAAAVGLVLSACGSSSPSCCGAPIPRRHGR